MTDPDETPRQLSDDELADLDEHEDDPPEFDRSRVPTDERAEYFFDARTGRGLTNEEYDEQIRRIELLSDPADGPTLADFIRGKA